MKDEVTRKQAGTSAFTRRGRPCACGNHFAAMSVLDWCGSGVLSGKRVFGSHIFDGRVGKTVCLRRWNGTCFGIAAVAANAVSASAADGIAGERHTDQCVGGMAVHRRCRACLSAVLGRLGTLFRRFTVVFTGSLPAGNLAAAATGAARAASAGGVGSAGDFIWHPVYDYGAANTDL